MKITDTVTELSGAHKDPNQICPSFYLKKESPLFIKNRRIELVKQQNTLRTYPGVYKSLNANYTYFHPTVKISKSKCNRENKKISTLILDMPLE